MNRHHSPVALLAAVALMLAACGGTAGPTAKPDRTVSVDMVDLAFRPDRLEVRAGETIRFVFRNRGKVAHDAFIGDEAAQASHEKEMQRMGGMGHGGSRAGLTVKPGKTGEITHTFGERGQLEIACHQPGHWKAGMMMSVKVG